MDTVLKNILVKRQSNHNSAELCVSKSCVISVFICVNPWLSLFSIESGR